MVIFNYATKEVTIKVVYYGPGLCGKTTNLRFIYDSLLIRDVLEGLCAFVAQLDRVTDFGSVGYRFEPYRAHHGNSRVLSSAG